MIADALRNSICRGEISPGAPLKQDEIAADFGVSHTPVREALKLLVAEGLAVLHHNRGCCVSNLSSVVARELTEFRAVIEPRLAAWAVDHLTTSDIQRARLIVETLDKTDDPAQRLQLATDFHSAIYVRANRPFFLDQVNRARNNLSRYWILAWGDRVFPAVTQEEHKEILALCESKNREGLMRAIEQHILSSGEIVLRYIEGIESN
ncbi:GntR family transcriptional regulator [Labrys wisconsinensis]|uniref:DNA-binding GntR family transcriptional regulator n=1 Tax=Labrys wisconsinensis TaxID=425677 RepID=A0ABU0J6Z6_9HYPH|nr:GntR family transcriptional regulator [Labrys wisconsinensis]MDQ0470037.1 DNA-binding GntR family transcriptional regulator [Labrys wisconsinensis]